MPDDDELPAGSLSPNVGEMATSKLATYPVAKNIPKGASVGEMATSTRATYPREMATSTMAIYPRVPKNTLKGPSPARGDGAGHWSGH